MTRQAATAAVHKMPMPSRPFLLLLLILLTVNQKGSCQETNNNSWRGCIDPNNDAPLSIGHPTRVCLQVANNINWNSRTTRYVRASFEPDADEYSRFYVPNSYRDLVKNSDTNSIFGPTKNITLGAASQRGLSFVKVYYDPASQRVYPFLTIIIEVDKGVVQGITWDNACVFCGGFSECQENTYNYNGQPQDQESSGQYTKSCWISTEQCDELSSDDKSCDITLYVVWSGTDRNGKALQSQSYGFRNFPPRNCPIASHRPFRPSDD